MAVHQEKGQDKTKPTAPTLETQPSPPYVPMEERGQFPLKEVDGRIVGTLTVELKEKVEHQQPTSNAQANRLEARCTLLNKQKGDTVRATGSQRL